MSEFVLTGVRSCVLEYRSVKGLRAAELLEFNEQRKVRQVLAHYHDEDPESSRR
jgi:hypothetical protein